MSARIEAAVGRALEQHERVRVIVMFDHRPTPEDLRHYDVVRELSSISAAVLSIDYEGFDLLVADDSVLTIELDGEVRALE